MRYTLDEEHGGGVTIYLQLTPFSDPVRVGAYFSREIAREIIRKAHKRVRIYEKTRVKAFDSEEAPDWPQPRRKPYEAAK